jgi:hypothetical protein
MERTHLKIATALPHSCRLRAGIERFLDIFLEDRQLNVYAAGLEVRPPRASTMEAARWKA